MIVLISVVLVASVVSAAAFTMSVSATAVTMVMSVSAACVAFAVVMTFAMVVTLYVRIEIQLACDESLYSRISLTHHASIKLDACLCQCVLCTAADTAADQNFYLVCCQESAQCAVAVAVCINNLACNNFAVFHIVNLEL